MVGTLLSFLGPGLSSGAKLLVSRRVFDPLPDRTVVGLMNFFWDNLPNGSDNAFNLQNTVMSVQGVKAC